MTDMFLMLLYYREEGMGDRGEGMQQMNTGRTQTWVAAFRTEPIRYALCPVSHQGALVIIKRHFYAFHHISHCNVPL